MINKFLYIRVAIKLSNISQLSSRKWYVDYFFRRQTYINDIYY